MDKNNLGLTTFKCPNPVCSVDKSRYFSEGPLTGTSKYCGFCSKNLMKYICHAIILICDDCRRYIDQYLTLHEHTFTIAPMFGIGKAPSNHNDIERYTIHCNFDCDISQIPSERPLGCEVIERLNDIDYWPTMNNGKAKNLSSIDLLRKLIRSLEKPCRLCSAIPSSSLVICRHFDSGTLDYSPIYPLCQPCFETYSLKHEPYPSHSEVCNEKKCLLEGDRCDYDWDALSGCIETGRDGHQIFCDDDCEELKKLKH